MTTPRTIITDAMLDLGIYASDETPTAEDAAFALRVFNRMISEWTGQGMRLVFPSGVTTWRGDWASGISYAANDGVTVSGRSYKCLVAHTSTDDDKPVVGLNQATYWTQSLPGTLTLDDSITPFDASDDQALISCLTERLAAPFGVPLTDMQIRRASSALAHLSARFMPVEEPIFDPALTRTPSRHWPYTTTVE
jgi:hypothetical protein